MLIEGLMINTEDFSSDCTKIVKFTFVANPCSYMQVPAFFLTAL